VAIIYCSSRIDSEQARHNACERVINRQKIDQDNLYILPHILFARLFSRFSQNEFKRLCLLLLIQSSGLLVVSTADDQVAFEIKAATKLNKPIYFGSGRVRRSAYDKVGDEYVDQYDDGCISLLRKMKRNGTGNTV
jgi:hypothetical protein